ncbi:class I SAM-dependent methyltransferase [Aquabacterium humicola]|uniref:class I SAM-dependent methyltransferase n=1 Tax=Aquabacterium humicola TaxID=3237377 RepID=UPI002543F339|nr:class I SAM-dependent methyltransferase [Rubrivivax pictus]
MKVLPSSRPLALALPWPLPALLAWLAAALAWRSLGGLGEGTAAAAATVAGTGIALAWPALGRWRRVLMAVGFPVAIVLQSIATGSLPPWAWLVPVALLLAAYPLRTWGDAPLFPTPPDALAGLQAATGLPADARVLDAGCGLGHGLEALKAALPQARLEGIEFSRPIAFAARRRCGFAQVLRGDMWRLDWSGYDLVYLFQRPDTMARAAEKAARELRPDAWLASLEFEVPGVKAGAVLRNVAGKPVWLYQARHVAGLFDLSDRSTAAARGR